MHIHVHMKLSLYLFIAYIVLDNWRHRCLTVKLLVKWRCYYSYYRPNGSLSSMEVWMGTLFNCILSQNSDCGHVQQQSHHKNRAGSSGHMIQARRQQAEWEGAFFD